MRLADTVFLTVPVALLQTFLGMRCSAPGQRCHIILGHHHFNILLLVSIIASLIGALRWLPSSPLPSACILSSGARYPLESRLRPYQTYRR